MKKTLIAVLSVLSLSSGICKDIVWSFPPTQLSNSSHNAINPQIATDANGNLVGVWLENGAVVAKTKLLNMSWSSSVTLSTATASSPLVVCDNAGNATAIWLQSGVVMASTKLFNIAWTPAQTLSSTGASTPALAVGTATGDVIAGWARGGSIQTSTKIFGSAWNTVKTISSTNASNPQIAIGGGTTGATESAVIAWNMTSGSVNAIAAATRAIQNNWSSQTVISDVNHNAGFPHVAVDPSGNGTAIWYLYDQSGNNYTNVAVQASTHGFVNNTWSTPLSISSTGIRNPATLSANIGFDSSGNGVALWTNSFDNETFNLEAAVIPVQGQWSNSVDLVSSNTFALSADLGVSALDDAIALYMFYNGNTLLVQSAESDTSGFKNNTWSVPILVSQGLTNGYPQIAVTLSGNTLYAGSIWNSFNGTNNLVFAATGKKALPLPPSGLAVVQSSTNFGFYQNYYNTLTWTASSDPSVVGYLIYRNGVFLEEVPTSVLHFVDNNRTPSVTDVYGVASVDNQNTHSVIVTH